MPTSHHGPLSARQRNASCLISNIIGAYWVQARTLSLDPDQAPSFVKNSEYDQKIPLSQTEDKPMAPRGRAAQPSQDTRKTNSAKQPALSSPSR